MEEDAKIKAYIEEIEYRIKNHINFSELIEKGIVRPNFTTGQLEIIIPEELLDNK